MNRKGTITKVGRQEIMTSNHQKQACYFKVYKKANVF